MNAILNGSLGAFRAERVLRLVAETEVPGRLVVSSSSRTITLWISGSNVCFADRGDPQAFRRLLEERGVVPALIDQLPRDAQPHADGYLASATTGLPREMLIEWSGWHTEEAVLDLLLLREGSFSFLQEAAISSSALECAVELTPLMEALLERLHLERAAIESVAFRATVPDGADRCELTATELRFLLAADGQRSVAKITKDEDFDSATWVMALRLWRRGLLERVAVVAAPDVADEQVAQPPPASPEGAPSDPPQPRDVTPEPPSPPPAASADAEGTVMDLPLSSLRPPSLSDSGVRLMACLTLEDEDRTSFPLFEDSYTVGRDDRNEIQIADRSVSGTHARITRTTTGYEIEDLGSRNGTFVNGEQIKKQNIKDQDAIRFGTVYATFSLSSQLQPSAATMFETPNPGS